MTLSSPDLPVSVSHTHPVASHLREDTPEMSPLTFIKEEICFYSPGIQNMCAGQAEVQWIDKTNQNRTRGERSSLNYNAASPSPDANLWRRRFDLSRPPLSSTTSRFDAVISQYPEDSSKRISSFILATINEAVSAGGGGGGAGRLFRLYPTHVDD